MAVCPTGAIRVTGRELSSADLFSLPSRTAKADFPHLLALLQRRRSIRTFTDKEVGPELINKIVQAAQTAPMGLPPSDVNILILAGKEQTRGFAQDFANYLKGLRFLTNRGFLLLMRPFWGKETDALFHSFIKPMFRAYTTDGLDRGINTITYDAPLALYFYGSAYCDPADPIVAATYAMVAAESLGLGTCMLGAIHPFLQFGRKAKQFRAQHQIHGPSKEGLFVLFGYPQHTFTKGIKRSFASVEYYRHRE